MKYVVIIYSPIIIRVNFFVQTLSNLHGGGSRNSLRPGPPSATVATLPSTVLLQCIDKHEHCRHVPGHGPGCQGLDPPPNLHMFDLRKEKLALYKEV
jgi:hypothetical protein